MCKVIPFAEAWRRDLPNMLAIKPEAALTTKHHTREEYEILKDICATIGRTTYETVTDILYDLVAECWKAGYSAGREAGIAVKTEARAFMSAIAALEECEQKKNDLQAATCKSL